MKGYYKLDDKRFKGELEKIRNILARHFSKNKFEKFDIDSKIYLSGLIDDLNMISENSNKKDLILDVGSGKGHISALLSLYFKKVTSIDLKESSGEGSIFNAENLGSRWQKNIWRDFEKKYTVNYKFYNGKKIPYSNNTFDIVVAYAVIEHVGNANNFLKECYRVLKDGGKLFIFRCPQKYALTENLAKLTGLPHHDILFSKTDLLHLLRKNKFSVKLIQKYDIMPAFIPRVSQQIINRFSIILLLSQKVLSSLHMNFFAHNLRVIAQKNYSNQK